MKRHCGTSRAGSLLRTLLRAAGLLLLTNLGWALWFVWQCDPNVEISEALITEDIDVAVRRDDPELVDWAWRHRSPLCTAYQIETRTGLRFRDLTGYSVRFDTPPDYFVEGLDDLLAVLAREQDVRALDPEERRSAICAFGWPAPLLWCGWIRTWTGWEAARSTGIALTDPPQTRDQFGFVSQGFGRVLPFRPMWRGQLVWGAFWFVAIALWAVVPRQWRRRRGCCIACGYDLRFNESGVCPECGAAIAAATSSDS